ncbi:MAG: ComEC/Rec2 family competence protein [Anaerolineae bacterium]|nr:ComEC/Rec2 family competence protein [Anaerolineae bacterium]
MTLFYLAMAWLAGIAVANGTDTSWWLWLALAGMSLPGIFLARRKPAWRTVFLCAMFLMLGAMRLSLSVPHFATDDIAFYNDQGFVQAEGVIVKPPEVRDAFASFEVRVDRLELPDGPPRDVRGRVQVETTATQEYHFGDRVRLLGELRTPPELENFSYRDVLARKGIYSTMSYTQVDIVAAHQAGPLREFMFDFRAGAHQMIKRLLPDPQAALLAGILLGIETDISPEVSDAFSAVGATHVIVISGSNLVIIAGLLQSLARRVLRNCGTVFVTIAGIVFYTLFVGGDPAVTRAVFMVTLGLIANQLGRQTYGMSSLGFAALAMTLINPFDLWNVSFQLSFMATLGLILYVEPLQNLLTNSLLRVFPVERTKQIVGAISDAFVVTVAAQITTTPIIALYFGRLSLLSLPTNFLIIPAQTPLMVLGGLAAIAALVSFPVGQFLAWGSWLFLSWTIEVVRFFADLPYASIEAENISPLSIAAVYAIIFGLTWMAMPPGEGHTNRWQGLRQSLSVKVIALFGLAIAILVFAASAALPNGRLHVSFIDTGSGSATLIVTPSGRHILVDAGGSGRRLSTALGDGLPFWSRRLDLVVLTQPGPEHTGALPTVLKRYQPAAWMTNGAPPETGLDAQSDWVVALPGTQVHVDDGVTLMVLHTQTGSLIEGEPGEPISLMVTYGDARILLPGNLSPEGIKALLDGSLVPESTILYLSHDRDDIASNESFLTTAGPQVTIIAVEPNKPLPEADQHMLSCLAAAGSSIYRADETGTVHVETDGRQMWIRTAQ